ncbi:hypothetical protein [Labilibaculum filiforme]|uniref:hypothetical protein n=1 Tax=Labilibaculum filiforme TaxID=1940526 RepID=UPI0015D5C869|nr:hypothetical protein [Labilibaculum filiforme]
MENEKKYRKGDCYYIPAGVLYAAKFVGRTIIMDYVAEKDWYITKNKFAFKYEKE